ncbi:MAG: 1-deoxy-D-xylulose-5-phosphate synthase, partial [Firmicutes bacterium]|nr:1-deoxy-D-xylulose-5-phosphate synthase [Bacillota bacterium]
MYLEKLNDVSDIKKLNFKELKILAQEMRDLITKSTDKCGGHLSSNLGVVELTQALYYVFDFENDKLIFDVGHQCYAHKILSGRKNEFVNLRKYGGLSGFPDRSESVFDAVATGHASTSLSLGLGLSVARDLHHKDYNVICVIGDGALSGGQSFEALNNIGIQKSGMIILLNDNEMSISKSNGVFLSKLRLSKSYEGFKNKFKFFGKFPLIGKITLGFMRFVRNVLKAIFVPVNIFDHFSINYYGPFDGHKTKKLIKLLQKAKGTKKPIVIHVLTKKGRGLIAAETAPDVFHGVKSGNECSNSVFSKGMGEFLCELAEKDKRIVAVTAAMSAGTGLTDFSKKFPERFFDVGICEQHAVTFSAGLADEGLAPYFCVYSTFLQRGFDQVIIDVCLNKLPVTFLIDRSGLVGADGKTHHGIFDLSILSCIPNLTILSPCDLSELKKMMEFSVNFNAPLAIRFCNDYAG